MFDDISKIGTYLGNAARLMVGQPNYEAYVAHTKTAHPDKAIMSREEFFRDRENARYGGKNGRANRCC